MNSQRANPSQEQLQAIISDHIGGKIDSTHVVHHNCNTHVYVSLVDGTQYIIRICDGPYWTEKSAKTTKFKAEKYAWGVIEQIDVVDTPRVIAIDADEQIVPYPYLIMTHILGTPMCHVLPELEASEQYRLVEELGAIACLIHALPVDPDSVPDEAMRWWGHKDDLRKQLHELVDRGLITTCVYDRIERIITTHSSRLAAMDEDIVFLHGDLHFGNVLLQNNNDKWNITGLVDAELAGIGPRGRELRALEAFSFREYADIRMRKAFLKGYGKGFALDDYKLAYLTSELCPDFLNTELVKIIESADFSEDLEWIRIFSD